MKFPKIDRFDLEEKIMNAWNIIEDIELVARATERMDINGKDYDTLLNLIIGVQELYRIRFQELFSSFEDYIQLEEQRAMSTPQATSLDKLFDEYESMLDKAPENCDTDILKFDLTD